MKNALAFLAAVVLIFTVMGLCLGWFGLAGYENNGGVHRISVDINTIKMSSDYQAAKQKLGEAIAKFQEGGEQEPATLADPRGEFTELADAAELPPVALPNASKRTPRK